MAQERPTKKRGGITGRAYVVMGGNLTHSLNMPKL